MAQIHHLNGRDLRPKKISDLRGVSEERHYDPGYKEYWDWEGADAHSWPRPKAAWWLIAALCCFALFVGGVVVAVSASHLPEEVARWALYAAAAGAFGCLATIALHIRYGPTDPA